MIGVQMVSGVFHVTAAAAAAPTSPPAPEATTAAPPQTALVPDIKVADQPMKNSSVIIPEVDSVDNTWLVIHKQNGDGTMGPIWLHLLLRTGSTEMWW